MNNSANIYELENEPVSGVAFVQDYIELHFDGKILRALAPPILQDKQGVVRFPEPTSRDRLCELVNKKVNKFEIEEGQAITLNFAQGLRFTIPLGGTNGWPGESAHYVPGYDKPILVWE